MRWIGSTVLVSLLVSPWAQLHAADDKPDELVQLVIDLVRDKDKDLRAAGLEQVRTEAKGPVATRQFAAELPKLDAAAQVGLLGALADRGDAAARPAVLELLASSRDDNIRAAALGALGSLGEPADIPLLVKSLSAQSPAAQAAARWSLGRMRGESVSKTLAADSRTAVPAVKAALIEILATRRAMEELPSFLAATTDDNAQVRSAAMAALGEMGRPDQIAAMLPGVLKAEKGAERDAAEKNVALVCFRIENEGERGETVVKALGSVSPAQRDQLLSLIGRIGGKKLISFVAEIATSKDAARRKLGIDALGKWPDASVADKLLEITNQATDPAERRQAFQGYVKISATRDNRTDAERLARMKEALAVAKSPEEQSLVLNRCRTAYSVETLCFVLPYADRPQFAQVACDTIVELAHHREIRDPNKAEFDKALDKVIQVSKDPVAVDRAQRYKRGETWVRPGKTAE